MERVVLGGLTEEPPENQEKGLKGHASPRVTPRDLVEKTLKVLERERRAREREREAG